MLIDKVILDNNYSGQITEVKFLSYEEKKKEGQV